MAGKARRIKLSGIKPVREKNHGMPMACAAPSKASKAKMDKMEKDWSAEHDAHTLSEAAAIHADPARRAAVRKAAQRMVEEQESKLANLRAITKKGAV